MLWNPVPSSSGVLFWANAEEDETIDHRRIKEGMRDVAGGVLEKIRGAVVRRTESLMEGVLRLICDREHDFTLSSLQNERATGAN